MGFGAIQRQLLIAKGLAESGNKVTVISFKGNHSRDKVFPPNGTFQGIHYHYASGTIHRPKGFLQRNWMKLVGRFRELMYIRNLKNSENIDAAYVSTDQFQRVLIYWIWLRWLHIPIILNYDELMSSIPGASAIKKFNDWLFDRFAVYLIDGVTPISEYLLEHTKSIRPSILAMKLPILCDFDKFNPSLQNTSEQNFVYCGAASYVELIEFVLLAFDQLDMQKRPIFLDLVLGGKKTDLDIVSKKIENSLNSGNIRLHPNVPHDQIPGYYASASALLIPMRPTIQDAARFPHKLGEYLASGRPVITTNFGEVQHYQFVDEETALVAGSYDPVLFAEKMKFVLEHPIKCQNIGVKGREMGLRNFNYQQIGLDLKNFIIKVVKKLE